MKSPEDTIKSILEAYKKVLKDDFSSYTNHCLRVYTYSKTLLLMRENRKLAICSAFHDLDIWANNTMHYLEGSAQLAVLYSANMNFLPDELRFIINNHHKVTLIKGNIEAEAFRKADLIDVSGGLIKFNIPKSLIIETESIYPRYNFTRKMAMKIFSHAFTHPLSPFPMLKW